MDISSTTSAALTAQTSSRETSQSLGSEDFLQLLSVQLQNQDPMDPMDDTEFISQMANFSSLEAMSSLSTSFDTFSQNQQEIASQAYLGKTVTVETELGDVTGLASALSQDETGDLNVTIGEVDYPITDIRRVALTSTTEAE